MFKNKRFNIKNRKRISTKNRSNSNIYNTKSQDYALKEGDSGEEVENLQRMLLAIIDEYPSLPIVTINGIYGSETKNAVERFQELNSLNKTGITDIYTYRVLKNIFNTYNRVNISRRK